MPRLAEMITPERIVELRETSKEDVLEEMVDVLSTAHEVHDRDAFLQAINDRESILSTGIGLGIAVPHAKIASVDDLVAALGKTKKGIDYGALDDQPVRIVVMIAAGESQQSDYIRALARVTLLLKNEEVRRSIIEADGPEEIYEIVKQY